MNTFSVSIRCLSALTLSSAMALFATFTYAEDSSTRAYEVKITNITSANQFTPVLAATHTRRASLFTLGNPPRRSLAVLAETGNTADLQASLASNGNTSVVQTFTPANSPLTFAGETLEFTIESETNVRYFSLASMILPTNDSFVGLDTVSLPVSGSVTYLALGYDAGSEINDEMCVNIPGPTCGGSGAFSGLNGEGFIHVSPGIHGDGDLDDAIYDWRNPVARVEITRIR